MPNTIPTDAYGIHERNAPATDVDHAAEELATLGYTVVDSGLSAAELDDLSTRFDAAYDLATAAHGGLDALTAIDEHNTIRCPMKYDRTFLTLAQNPQIMALCEAVIGPYVTLSQQNGIINPGNKAAYNQGKWHRDLPFQHNVFTRPIAINALFCLDDFTHENGATFVLPATHKQGAFPSEEYLRNHAKQIAAKRGSFLVLDCMMYHTGGVNLTAHVRRGINHVFAMPLLRQQVNLATELGADFARTETERRLLGYDVATPDTVAGYFDQRRAK